MTVLTQTPEIIYTGNGNTTFFQYPGEVPGGMGYSFLATVNNTYQPYTAQALGVVFDTPPPAGSVVRLWRITDLTQLLDFKPFEKFRADKTEFGVDKLILLKQEAIGYRANLNLYTHHYVDRAVLVNDKGEDPVIYLWNNGSAGLYSGIVTQDVPPDNSSTTYPDNYVWHQWGEDVVAANVLTSTQYALLVQETLDVSADYVGVTTMVSPTPSVDVSSTISSINLVVTVGYKDYSLDEELDLSSTVASIDLPVVVGYKDYTNDEEIDLTSTILSAALDVVVGYTYADDEIELDIQSTVASISLDTP